MAQAVVGTVQPMEVDAAGEVVRVGGAAPSRKPLTLALLAFLGMTLASASVGSAVLNCKLVLDGNPANCTRASPPRTTPRSASRGGASRESPQCLLFRQTIFLDVYLGRGEYCTVPHCEAGCSLQNPDTVGLTMMRWAEPALGDYIPGGSMESLQQPGCEPLSLLVGMEYIIEDPDDQDAAHAALDQVVTAIKAIAIMAALLCARLLLLWSANDCRRWWAAAEARGEGAGAEAVLRLRCAQQARRCACHQALALLVALLTLTLGAALAVVYTKYIASYDLDLELLAIDSRGTVDLTGDCSPAQFTNLMFAVAGCAILSVAVARGWVPGVA
jgi:hypothetical protein